MSLRAEKGDAAHFRRPGRPGNSAHHYKTYSAVANAGAGRSSGGGGGGGPVNHPPAPPPAAAAQTRSYKKVGNGQGPPQEQQPRVNAAVPPAAQNGSTHASSHGSSVGPALPASAKPVEARNSKALPKAPTTQPAAGGPETTAPRTPPKGDASKSVPFQFGTISPGVMNGMQIPARTSSAPPNLDEQKLDQARHGSLRAVPTLPVPTVQKQQLQPTRKDAGVNSSNTVESHLPAQTKRDAHVLAPPIPTVAAPKSSVLPIGAMPMTMHFQQSQVPLQFGGPCPQMHSQGVAVSSLQMAMTLPVGNAPQVPQQMFMPGIHSHPLQTQAIMHQGPGLGFTPQIHHQLAPQIGNLGVGVVTQFPQQQPGKFGGPGPRKSTVKITHPETHEELRLDKRTDSYMDSGTSGQRHLPNVTPQSQPIPAFNLSHQINCFPSLQPNSYSGPPLFLSSSLPLTSTPMNIGPQAPRYSYPVNQGAQPIPFMNQSIHNLIPGSKPGPPSLHSVSEAVKLEGLPISVPPVPVQVTLKPPISSYGGAPSVTVGAPISRAESSVTISTPVCEEEPSVTINMPISKAEAPKLLKPSGDSTTLQLQRDREFVSDSSFQQPKPATVPLDKNSVLASDRYSSVALPVLLTQRTQRGISSSAPVTPVGESGSLIEEIDDRKREPIRRSESLKEHQRKPGKRDNRHSQQQLQGGASDLAESRKLSPSKILEDNGADDVVSQQVSMNFQHSQAPSIEYLSTSIASSPSVENVASLEIGSSEAVKGETIGISPGSFGVVLEAAASEVGLSDCSVASGLTTDGTSIKQKASSEVSTSSCHEVEQIISEGSDSSSPNGTFSVEFGQKQKNLPAAEHGKAEVSYDSSLDSRDAKVYPVSTIIVSSILKEVGEENSGKSITSELSDGEKQQHVTSDEMVDFNLEVDREAEESNRCAIAYPDLTDAEAVPSTHEEGSKDKSSSEPTRTKTIGGKKKRKEILSKADAAGASDLYNAYKGPEQKQQIASTSESTDSSFKVDVKHVSVDVPYKDTVAGQENGHNKGELDDWEDAADISSTKLNTSENGLEAHGGRKHNNQYGNTVESKKKYTRDFLLTFAEKCSEIPVNFDIGSDIADALMSVPAGAFREPHPNSGRIRDRPSGGTRSDRIKDDGKWTKSPATFGPGMDVGHGHAVRTGQGLNHGVPRNQRGQSSHHFVGGVLSGQMQSAAHQGGMSRNIAEADRRKHTFQKGLILSPQTPLQVMHKAEKKYEVGKVTDTEEAKQRRLKAILNKLTPQNFEKLFEQVKEVNIDSAVTLTGVISQIFDKALMEPTFCEMYSDFCFHLAGVLPDFSEDNEKITFRRLLLNKCQEEFERGEREQAEADKVEEEGETKQSEVEREEKRLRVRRRMLGNIRLIGELYKKKMLTERIMHECIKKLLGQHENPDEEDIEALCKLMATIGQIIDHSKAKEHMDAYFDMMQMLSTNQKLSSRVRFLLRDAIDLRKNKWQQRRKVEGPKKIDQVRRDAVQERQAQAGRSSRGPVIGSTGRRGPPVDYGSRGSVLASPSSQQTGSIRSLLPQSRGYTQDVRLGDRHQFESRTLSVPLAQRHTDDGSITLGPQGGLARGMSIRGQPLISNVPSAEIHPSMSDPHRISSSQNGYSSIPDRVPSNSKEEIMSRSIPDRMSGDQYLDISTSTALSAGRVHGPLSGRPTTPEVKPLSEEALRKKSISAIREFYSAKDEEEVALCVRELNSPSFYPSIVSFWVMDSFERKDLERDLLARLLVNLCKSHDSLLSHMQLIQGFESVLRSLEDAVNDAPKAGEFLGRIFAVVILENVVSLKEIGSLIREGGEEPGRLLEIGLASEVLGSILESIKTEKGDAILNEIRTSSNLQLEDFHLPHLMKSKKLDAFM